MATVTAQVRVRASAQDVWDAVTDWTNHERWIPFTRVRVLTAEPGGAGARFVARTGLGLLSVDDVMQVTAWAPPERGLPGRWSVVKQGRLVHGGATFQIENVPPANSASSTEKAALVTWTETLTLAPERLTRPLSPLIAVAARVGLVRALRLMAQEFERGQPGPDRG